MCVAKDAASHTFPTRDPLIYGRTVDFVARSASTTISFINWGHVSLLSFPFPYRFTDICSLIQFSITYPHSQVNIEGPPNAYSCDNNMMRINCGTELAFDDVSKSFCLPGI